MPHLQTLFTILLLHQPSKEQVHEERVEVIRFMSTT
jgi:hypothetical protein